MSNRFCRMLANKQSQNLYDIYLMLYVQLRTLMMDRKTVRNM